MHVDADLLPAITHIIADTELKLKNLIGVHVSLRLELHDKVINEVLIQTLVCTHFDIPWTEIIGKKRKTPIKNARFVYIWLCIKWLPKKTVSSIAKDINRDHSSVIHARDTINDFVQVNDQMFTSAISSIESKLRVA